MPAPARFSRRARPRGLLPLLACAGLAFVAALQPAWADRATLVLDDVCADPAATFDGRWATLHQHSQALFLMRNDGTVVKVGGRHPTLDDYDRLTVAAHGGCGSISDGMTYRQFIAALKIAHPSVPTEVFFIACGAGKGGDSLLKQVNTAYNLSIGELNGCTGECALTGNGVPGLITARYRNDAGYSDRKLFDTIQDNIEARWKTSYPPQPSLSYVQACKGIVAAPDFDAAKMTTFLDQVYEDFSKPALVPTKSHNYLDLVELSVGGSDLVACGANPGGHGHPIACP